MRAYERLLNYVKVYTTSEDEQENVPSTSRQFDLGNQLAEELKDLRISRPLVLLHIWTRHLISQERT